MPSHDCMVFCVFCRTESNEKITRPETYSPGNTVIGVRLKIVQMSLLEVEAQKKAYKDEKRHRWY